MNATPSLDPKISGVTVRPMREEDLIAADRVMRLAFGTFLAMPDPSKFMGDADYVRTRWLTDPAAAFTAEMEGEVVGSNFATCWGSVGFFGPLTIRPDLWDRGIAQLLLAPTMELFDRWEIRHAGLFTFASSAKHVGLYQKFGFWPRFLTALMERPVGAENSDVRWIRFSQLSPSEKQDCLQACMELTSGIFPDLDLSREINAVDKQRLGDTIFIWEQGQLAGLAVCHVGPGTEAGSGKCYIKFAAVPSGPSARSEFRRLLEACGAYAIRSGAAKLTAGVNLGRLGAYQELMRAGFRTTAQGVVMERNAEPGYNRPEVFLIDDWR